MTPTITLEELTELSEIIEGRANHQRGLSNSRNAPFRDYHNGRADANDSDARLVRDFIARLTPRPALRIVKEEAHG